MDNKIFNLNNYLIEHTDKVMFKDNTIVNYKNNLYITKFINIVDPCQQCYFYDKLYNRICPYVSCTKNERWDFNNIVFIKYND